MVEAIGNLWPLTLVVLLIICVILFHRQIRGILDRLTKIELSRGDTRFSGSLEPPETETPEQQARESEATAPERKEVEPSEEVLDAEPPTEGGWLQSMVFAALDKDSERLEQTYRETLSAETDATEKRRIEGFYWRLRYELGDTSALSKLQDLAEAVKDSPDLMPEIYSHLGHAYEMSNDYLRATEAFETASLSRDALE